MTWWQSLLEWDTTVFLWINRDGGNAVFDAVLPWFREKLFWAPLYLFLAAFALFNFGRQGRLILIGLLLTVALADFTSSAVIKQNVKRLRPCNDPALSEQMVLRVSCGSGYSFTSSHATNHFAVAVYLIGIFGGLARWIRPALLLWAGLIALAQVYVGVHYPADVTAGAFLGTLIGQIVFRVGSRYGAFPDFSGPQLSD